MLRHDLEAQAFYSVESCFRLSCVTPARWLGSIRVSLAQFPHLGDWNALPH
jgi:hypothetical protein